MERRSGSPDRRSYSRDRGPPRENDQANTAYVGKLNYRTREETIRREFERFGSICRVIVKRGYAFVEYDDPNSKEDAIREMHDKDFDGARIIVEAAGNSKRERKGPNKDDKCFNCGEYGHWASDCRERGRGGGRRQDISEGRCFTCGERGHRARECRERSGSRGRYRRDRSPPRRRGRYRSYSDSRSPPRRRRGSRDR